MTRDDIIRMAHEANIGTYINLESYLVGNHLERFAELVAAAEREWVGLTREELAEIAEFHFHGALSGREFYDDVETKLKEKNT